MTATISMDYQNATLVCLMWHAFGRASVMPLDLKQGLSVSANNVEHMQQPLWKSVNKKIVPYKTLLQLELLRTITLKSHYVLHVVEIIESTFHYNLSI